MYALFMVIMQIPAMAIIQKIGYRKSAFISNLFNIVYVGILMFSSNGIHLCIAEFMSAVTFALKDVAEPSLLNASIPKTEKKGKIYAKLEGKGRAHYYYLNAITAGLSGFIYAVNPYLPLILSMLISGLACCMSLLFEEVEEEENEKQKVTVKKSISDIKESIKVILKSNRLRSLMLYSGIAWGFMCLASEYRESILKDIGTPSQIMGIMTAIFGIVSGIASKKQIEFHNLFRNHTLSVIIISCAVSMIISALVVLIGLPFFICIIIILLDGIIAKSDNAMSNILVNRYLGNFTTKEIISKIYATDSIAKNLFRMIIGMIGSLLITIVPSANAMLYAGIAFLVVGFMLILYMKPRVGLKPEEYPKKEIEMKI